MKAELGRATFLLLFAALFAPGLGAATPDPQVWTTTADGSRRLDGGSVVAPARGEQALAIELQPGQRHQAVVGFGAAITDASAWLIQQQLDEPAREALLAELFGRGDHGLGLSFTRLTIGASDFSRHHYSLDDPPDGKPDPQLAHFDIGPNRADVIPVARAALALNPQLKIMASPWSAPAWMKSSNSLITGHLLPAYYDAFARYLLRYVDAYQAEGVPIWALSVQNEPDFEPKDYPGMRLNAAQRARLIGDHLGPMLAARGGRPLLFDWDHNWDKPQEPLAVLRDPAAGRYVDAVAWHCYEGEPSAQSPVHDAFPDKDAYMTECSGGTWEPLRSGGMPLVAKRMLVLPLRHWARGILLWNLALDENRGPHAGGCATCSGVVMIDSRDGTVTRNDEYYVLGHASRFVRPGAVRIGSTDTGAAGVDNVAFRNADDGSVVLVAVNSNAQPRAVELRLEGREYRHVLPGRSLTTVVWGAAASEPVAHTQSRLQPPL
ncbi:MAG TPA: glycoside hydrolase family 30 beta sandwich domain-containing protein [Stenotrophomonas sp.]|nr:glycoside hydrolase family 30 beta sandwich domain-containing protein [Stenotrophomonas sp.]